MKNNQILINQILEQVKKHKKYSSISNTIVKKEILSYLIINPKTTLADKQTIKEIRAKLHRVYSSYQTRKKGKRNIYLEELKKDPENIDITNQLLSITLSTKERLNSYQEIYKKIFKITGKPKTIIDIGAGLNPLSFPYMKLKQLTYFAYDIDLEDIKFLNKYFKIMKIKGKAKIMDVRELNNLKKLPSSDITFMFKLIDLIDSKSKRKNKISEELITYLLKNKTKFIVASFATHTLTRKSMNLPRRRGFELMLERNQLSFKIIKTSNEVFYIIYI